jgi:hypothetical protein
LPVGDLGSQRVFFNGDLALKASELNSVIDAILANGLVFQAMHQHYFDLDPMVWFIHFHGQGHPLELARPCAASSTRPRDRLSLQPGPASTRSCTSLT